MKQASPPSFADRCSSTLVDGPFIAWAIAIALVCAWTASCTGPIPAAVQLPQSDAVVLTIQNPEPWSGKEGEPRPNWLGWGAETFTITSEASVWIADTGASPARLLHVSFDGDILQEISLVDLVVFPYDLAASQEGLWVLDIASDPAKVIHLRTDGSVMSSVAIPREIMEYEGEVVNNGVFNLLIGEKNELYLGTLNGFYELLDASGGLVARSLEYLSYYGHTYGVGHYNQMTGTIPALVDGVPLDTPPGFVVGPEAFLGFNSDGSFALAVYVQVEEYPSDYLVAYYTPSGEQLGTARQWPQMFYRDFNHHLAFGPDGAVYQLVSDLDHSVYLVRLGFFADLPARNAPPVIQPTPLTALPVSSEGATAEELARNALLAFFTDLSAGQYENAVRYFGGTVEGSLRQRMTGEAVAEYWKYLCENLWCLPVAEITEVEHASADEYIFYTVFVQGDGTRFEIGACCGGDSAATPPVWQFAYGVRLIEGEWKVMRAPLFTP